MSRYQKGNAVSITTSAQPAQLTRNERLDRLPFNKAHRKLLVASGIGWAFDAMDVGLVSFVVAAIIAPLLMSWFLTLSGGNKAVAFIIFAAAFILACIAALCLPERKGLNLED